MRGVTKGLQQSVHLLINIRDHGIGLNMLLHPKNDDDDDDDEHVSWVMGIVGSF